MPGWRIFPLLLAVTPALAGCPPTSLDGGLCAADADCASGETCVFDLTRSTSYCARRCALDSDCPVTQSCRTGTDIAQSGATELKLCIERVRECATSTTSTPAPDPCNGLDDDCDGVVDGPSCVPITDCLDSSTCGAFVCTAPADAAATLCGPANASATVADFSPCTADAQCASGLCETGTCSPLCRPRSVECPGEMVCARAVGARNRPLHNACQTLCKTSNDCADPQQCVFRDVYRGPGADPLGSLHAFVCSIPGPERKPLGAPCTANTLAGDDECAHGLCFGGVCTRPCERGSSCADVGAGFVCAPENLRYGTALQIAADICEAM